MLYDSRYFLWEKCPENHTSSKFVSIKKGCLLKATLILPLSFQLHAFWSKRNQFDTYTIKLHLPKCHICVCHWTLSLLVQIMACRLFGAKPLLEPMLTYCQFIPSGRPFSERINIQNFPFIKMHWKMSSAKWQIFCPRGNELNKYEKRSDVA